MSESRLKKLGVGKRLPGDPLFAAGDKLCRMYVREGIVDDDDEQLLHQAVAVFPCEIHTCKETFSSLLEYEMHYNSRHRFMCNQCRKFLPSAHFLDLHVSESHDSFFAVQALRKPMFRCFVEECSNVSQDVSERRSHCINVHKFPCNFRYDQSLKKNKKENAQVTVARKNDGEAMVTDTVETNRKQFTFGHVKQGKSFALSYKGKHLKKKTHENKESRSMKPDESMEIS